MDTNILIYLFDSRDPIKQQQARQLVKHAIGTEQGCISYQVVQEFLNVLTKIELTSFSTVGIRVLLDQYLSPLCHVHSSMALVHRALDLKDRWRYGFYDSLIIAAALQANCILLYSEDMQHSQKIETLTIVNPFLDG